MIATYKIFINGTVTHEGLDEVKNITAEIEWVVDSCSEDDIVELVLQIKGAI